MPQASFYTELPTFKKFSDFTKDQHFHALPSDWVVVISDIQGSTQAIADGRYKDVNLIGAATIVTARNALSRADFPFVFGGDGATFAVHKNDLPTITSAMAGLERMAAQNFDLKLRVGVVSVADLYDAGAEIEVARYELIEGKHVAIFRGDGLSIAEKWIKKADSTYTIAPEENTNTTTNLDGLSCRWNAIPNIRGTIVSLIIEARNVDSNKAYDDILQNLNAICDGNLEAANPVNIPAISYQSLKQCLFQENRLHLPKWNFKHFYRMLEILVCVLIFRFKIPPLFFDAVTYSKALRTHADYQKFDGVLRMVIDVSLSQCDAIEQYLDSLEKDKIIFYGLHSSKESLMTCYVDDVHQGNHIHFIDGADGGYAIAAKQMKEQIKDALN